MESPYSDECVIGRGLRQISSPAHGLAQPSSNSPLPAPVTTRKPSATSSSESDGGCHLSSQPPKTGSNFSHSADPIELESGTVWRPFSYIVRNPPPLHIMSHSGRFFGGPTVAVHPGGKLAGWAKYHLVPANGILDTVESEDLRLFNNQVGSNTAAGTAAIFGLAAGRMVVVLSGGQTLKLSGFWVDGDIFITCEHFYEDGMDETQRAAEKEYLMRGSTGRGHHYATTVSSLLCANNNGPEACQVRLVASDHDADISVWVAMRPRKAPGHSVLLSQLRGHDDHTSWTVVPTFTVCYASGDWNWSKKEKADNAQETLMSGYNKANEGRLTQYSFLRRQYLSAALPNKELDFELEKNSIQQYPQFEELFEPNKRALAVGSLSEPTHQEYQDSYVHLASGAKFQNAYTRRHTIPGFHGCSGGMICWFKNKNLRQPEVIGIFRGELSHQTFNSFVAFTTHGVAWIQQTIDDMRKAQSSFI